MPSTLDQYYPFTGITVVRGDWTKYTRWFGADGILAGQLNEFAVSERAGTPDLSVDVATGRAIVQGHFGESGSIKNLPVTANATGSTRFDSVVLRILFDTPRMELDVKAGTTVPPTLTQDGTTWEIELARIAVPNGAATIVNANLTDLRPRRSGGGFVRLPNVASAATLVLPNTGYLPPATYLVPITGTTTITAITPAAPAGTVLILEFASAGCQVSDTGLLLLTQNYVSEVKSTLLLVSDGTSWLEVARSTHNTAANVHGLPANVNVLGNRNASGEFIQRGSVNTSVGGTVGVPTHFRDVAVTFPVAFSAAPKVLITSWSAAVGLAGLTAAASTTAFTARQFDNGGTGSVALQVDWVALGS